MTNKTISSAKTPQHHFRVLQAGRGQLKCDGTHAETIFRLSAKRTSPFKLAGASVQSTTGSRGVHISDGNAGYTMFRGSVKGKTEAQTFGTVYVDRTIQQRR